MKNGYTFEVKRFEDIERIKVAKYEDRVVVTFKDKTMALATRSGALLTEKYDLLKDSFGYITFGNKLSTDIFFSLRLPIKVVVQSFMVFRI